VAPVAVMRDYVAAVQRGDWEAAYAFLSDDVAVHVPGRSALAGERRGRDAAIAYIEAARAKSRGADVEVELVGMLSSDERVMLLVRERFARGDGRVVEIERANVYTVRGGAIVEAWIFEGDQYAVDELLLRG
jgi:uncharacterized protein